ncbi:MAG TPA: phosphate signaling complex protein PhoU [Bacillota bacterium]
MSPRTSLEQELNELQARLIRMGTLVEEAIRTAVESLKNRDLEAAQRVIDGDAAIDDLELEIEQACLRLLALQQPMAGDLRAIGTMLKLVTDLERMADHATDIARATLRIGQDPLIKPLVDIPRMAELAQEMLRQGLNAYLARDPELALAMAKRDDELDGLYKQVFRELLVLMMSNPATIEQATQLLMVAQHLERVGDHATNLAEWVVYLVQGERRELND